MQPWKMFIRSVSVVTLLTAGGFAAGQAVVPFANTSRNASPAVEEAPDTEAPTVDPAAEVDQTDSTTTTTEAPKPDAPSVDPVDDPAPIKPPAVETPDESTTTTTTATPIDVTAAPPAVPVADPAPAVAPKAKKAKKAKKEKGDHNCDFKPDNGWHNKTPDTDPRRCPPRTTSAPAPAPAPASAPVPAPAPAPQDKGRPATAPAHPEQAKDGDRPEGAPGRVKEDGRPATGFGQSKKSL
jgi:ribonuclease E